MAQMLSDVFESNLSNTPSYDRWEAELHLGYQHSASRTVLRHYLHRGPLAVQRALYPEGSVCHSHLLHPPGGLVGGDSLKVFVETKEGAEALLTTPGATRCYRSDGRVAFLKQSLKVVGNSRLEWLPLENIAFPNAHLVSRTDIQISSNARFAGWEIWTLGQPASNQTFDKGVIDGMTTVSVDGKLLLCECLRVNPSILQHAAAALRGYPVVGSLFAYSDAKALSQLLKNWWAEQEQPQELEFGISCIDGLLAVRALAANTETLFHILSQCWLRIRKHWTGTTPDVPRIWRT